MTSLQTFESVIAQLRRRFKRMFWIAMAFSFTLGSFLALFQRPIENRVALAIGNARAGTISVGVLFYTSMLVPIIVVLVRIACALSKDERLKCPNCQKGLFMEHVRVISTRKCTYCKTAILSDRLEDLHSAS